MRRQSEAATALWMGHHHFSQDWADTGGSKAVSRLIEHKFGVRRQSEAATALWIGQHHFSQD